MVVELVHFFLKGTLLITGGTWIITIPRGIVLDFHSEDLFEVVLIHCDQFKLLCSLATQPWLVYGVNKNICYCQLDNGYFPSLVSSYCYNIFAITLRSHIARFHC